MKTILKSQPNFRDLGGVTTQSGRKVKEKHIFRSGYLGKIDEKGLSTLQELNVKTIIDLRTPEEIEIIGKGNYPNSITYKNIILSAGNVTKYLIPIFEKGDIMVCQYTDIGWSPYFAIIGGIITEIGSPLSHGAVVAREYGIPAIVNMHGAMDQFSDHDEVEIDTDKTNFIQKSKVEEFSA